MLGSDGRRYFFLVQVQLVNVSFSSWLGNFVTGSHSARIVFPLRRGVHCGTAQYSRNNLAILNLTGVGGVL